MTLHITRCLPADGSNRTNKDGHKVSPRLSTSYEEPVFADLRRVAHLRKVPASTVVREAVQYYLAMVGNS